MSNIFHLSQLDAKKQVADAFSSDDKFCYSSADVKNTSSYMVADNLSAFDCLALIRDRKVTSIVQNSIQGLSDKLIFLKAIDYKFEDYFNKDLKMISTDGVIQSFGMSDDRDEIIGQAFLPADLDMDMTKYQYLFQVAAELVMNAQIDAPKISGKFNVPNSLLVVEKNKDKGLVAISVIDYYGSLDCYKMLENIYAAQKDGFRDSMSKNSIGAGLGSAMVYEHVDSLIIGVIPGVISRVTAILPYGVSEKKINQIQKSIHIIKG
jgi:hypothetical protein